MSTDLTALYEPESKLHRLHGQPSNTIRQSREMSREVIIAHFIVVYEVTSMLASSFHIIDAF